VAVAESAPQADTGIEICCVLFV